MDIGKGSLVWYKDQEIDRLREQLAEMIEQEQQRTKQWSHELNRADELARQLANAMAQVARFDKGE